MEIDAGGLIALSLGILSLILYAAASRREEAQASADRRERLQEAISPRPATSGPLAASAASARRRLPFGARMYAMLKPVLMASVVLGFAVAALFAWGDVWYAVAASGVAGLVAVGCVRLGLDRMSREENGMSGTHDAAGGVALTSDLGLAVDNEGEPLDEYEVRMIRGVVGLDSTIAREIMAPRVDVQAVEIATPLSGVVDRMIQSGHSRIPVYRDDLDHIEGLVYARDLLKILNGPSDPPESLTADMLRAPLFIPETKTLEELLPEFQRSRVHVAIVIDEYGGVEGLVTIEDLLEQIVGEIEDEFDTGEPDIEESSKGEFVIDARASLDDIRDHLGVDIQGDGFDTVGGLVYDQLGKIPTVGETVTYDSLTIEVVSTVGRRLKKLKVTAQAAE